MLCRVTYLLKTLVFILVILSAIHAQSNKSPIIRRKKIAEVNTIGILPVNFDYYHLTAGGIRGYDDSLSIRAREAIFSRIHKKLLSRDFSPINLSLDTLHTDILKPIRRFYNVVNAEIRSNVFGAQPLPGSRNTFSYSLPPMEEVLSDLNVDAILFVNGFDDRSTNLRRRLKGEAVAGAVAGVMLAVFLGVGGGIPIVPPDYTVLCGALVNGKGEIIWYHPYIKTGNKDMVDRNDVNELVNFFIKTLHKGS